MDVHELRNEVDAILVGIGTVLKDNPSLTTRLADCTGKNPIRIVLDRSLRTPLDATIASTTEARTIIVTQHGNEEKAAAYTGVEFIYVSTTNDQLNLHETLAALYARGITDVLVEGGGAINASFLREGLIDKAVVYMAPKLLGGAHSITPFTGLDVETVDAALQLDFAHVEKFGDDLRITAYPKKG